MYEEWKGRIRGQLHSNLCFGQREEITVLPKDLGSLGKQPSQDGAQSMRQILVRDGMPSRLDAGDSLAIGHKRTQESCRESPLAAGPCWDMTGRRLIAHSLEHLGDLDAM